MKSLTLLVCLIILNGNGKNCSGFSFITILNHKIQVYKTAVADTEQQIQHYGYPMETYHVTTPDGYILTVQRIIHKPKTTGCKPVLLLPGMSTTSSVFVQFSNSLSCRYFQGLLWGFAVCKNVLHTCIILAFYLANKGYDVWLGNLRGSLQYSHHVKYSQLDSKFWDFSWEEMGDHDVPSTVDYILHKTNHTELPIITWSMSSIVTAAMLAAKPEYNNKVMHHIALAPVIYRYYTYNLLFSVLLFFYDILKGLYDLAVDKGIWNYIIFKAGLPIAPIACLTIDRSICETIMALIAGYTPAAQEASITVAHVMGGLSFKTGLHILQLIKHGPMMRFDYGSVKNLIKYGTKTPPTYNLTRITVPTSLFYGANDPRGNSFNVEMAARLIKTAKKKLMDDPMFTHTDFVDFQRDNNNMKIHSLFILILILHSIALANSLSSLIKKLNSKIELYKVATRSASELIRIHKYSVEKLEVKTTDGYILTLLRIPTGLKNLSRNGIPVLILPGLSCKPNIYVTSSDSIAYFLADHGFDVWLGNNRGNLHYSRHVRYPKLSNKFWNFSWEEIGYYDIPAMINNILKKTGYQQLVLISYSMTSASALALHATSPLYNQKSHIAITAGDITGGASFKILMHLLQQVKYKEMRRFDYGKIRNLRKYGSKLPPAFNFSKITTPTFLFSGANDVGATPINTALLERQMKTARTVWLNHTLFTHADYVWSIDPIVKKEINRKILGEIKAITLKRNSKRPRNTQ
uniref:Partial AB-hydrolase lipase domain-containing protein n=1 Tax=Strigamia maritima TaxID=126957 RepID=T1JGF4_STRMM